MSATPPVAEKAGDSPVIRGVKQGEARLVLWPITDPAKKHQFSGELDKVRVYGFIKERKDNPSQKFVTLSAKGAGPDGGYTQVAIGNPVNTRADGSDVYFDSLVFHLADDETLGARLTKTCSDEMQKSLGFTSPRVARPPKPAADAAAATKEEEAADSAPAP